MTLRGIPFGVVRHSTQLVKLHSGGVEACSEGALCELGSDCETAACVMGSCGYAQSCAELIELTSSGRLTPYVAGRYSLEDAGVAMRAMMDRKAAGKLVIEP